MAKQTTTKVNESTKQTNDEQINKLPPTKRNISTN